VSHSERAHARLAPSSAARWMACPGSIPLSADLPDTSSASADEGTAAHQLAELMLKGEPLPDYVDVNGVAWEVTDEMVGAVEVYVNECRRIIRMHLGVLFRIETRLDLSHIGLDFGTADFVAYDPRTQTVYTRDLKYGQRHVVEAEQNAQQLIYASGAANLHHDYGVKFVDVGIVQPRAYHRDGPVRSWTIGDGDLIEFELEVKAAAEATRKPDAPLVAGEHCLFCKAAAICPAKRSYLEHQAMVVFSEPTTQLPAPERYDPEELSRMLHAVGAIKNWCAEIERFAHAEAMHGRPPPGFKVVAKRATRKWGNEDAAADALIAFNDIYHEPELKSPAQIEKLIGKKKFAEVAEPYVTKESSGTVLAPVDDPRVAIETNPAAIFLGN
jgi:hypothetical protein